MSAEQMKNVVSKAKQHFSSVQVQGYSHENVNSLALTGETLSPVSRHPNGY